MYATVEDANKYIRNYYSSTDPLRLRWEGIKEEDQQILLNRSEQLIDLLPFKGSAVNLDKAFPRDPNRDISLERAKTATIELTIQMLDDEAGTRYEMQKQGVSSYKIGDLSETFKDTGITIEQHIISIVNPFLKDWLGGGYCICHTHDCR